jgi:hypothetical protein
LKENLQTKKKPEKNNSVKKPERKTEKWDRENLKYPRFSKHILIMEGTWSPKRKVKETEKKYQKETS